MSRRLSDDESAVVTFRTAPAVRDLLLQLARDEDRRISGIVRDLVLEALQHRQEARASEADDAAPSPLPTNNGATKRTSRKATLAATSA